MGLFRWPKVPSGHQKIADCMARNGGRHNWGPLSGGTSTCRTCGQLADAGSADQTMAHMQALDRNDRQQYGGRR